MRKILFVLISVFLFASCGENNQTETTDFKKVPRFQRSKKYAEYERQKTVLFGQQESGYSMNYKLEELQKSKKSHKQSKALDFISRGPYNVGGRTRSIIVDPDDATHKTWYAAAASGGIWKTTDGGDTWTNLTPDWPVLPVSAMAMANSNHDVIYAGTGESFPGSAQIAGSGVFKSTDRGTSWTQLSTTANNADFRYVNRIVVDPTNPDNVLAATTTGVFKSTNGGADWTAELSSYVEDLDADPTDFNVLYASCNLFGVYKSTDMGNTWISASNGMPLASRIELAVSPVDANYVYASVNESSDVSYVYISDDKAITWRKLEETGSTPTNFLTQGDYDNTLAGHPYDKLKVFVGGVNMWLVNFTTNTAERTEGQILGASSTANFITWVNFGGVALNGGVDLGTTNNATDLVATDWASVEVRFGPGKTQKAHRFTVPDDSGSGGDGGAGVPYTAYQYQDYIDVPFEVWDVTNNRQLMISFRDNERDGAFDLKKADEADASLAREYLFIHAAPYDAANADANIAKDAGHVYKMLYFFWPRLDDAATWDAANLPESKINVDYGKLKLQYGDVEVVTDAYGSGDNNYDQGAGFGTTAIPGVHPDHHAFEIIPIDQATNSFLIVNGSDGGIAISENSGQTFQMKIKGYVTTQFYGIARHPTEEQYIGGTQDNGTWQSQLNDQTNSYLFRIGGDGFETVWHAENPNLILGSVYYNSIRKSGNGGVTFATSTNGITSDDGPFVTRIRSSQRKPDNVYAVGATGVYYSTNFGSSWTLRSLPAEWAVTDVVTSSHYVQPSIANPEIVWAGAGMTDGLSLYVSENSGSSFTAVQKPTSPIDGYVSGIFTHPHEEKTAYVLYSFADESKIMRTTDLGQTWEDISGFDGTSATSTRGFPNVVTSCLLVMPQAPSTIWVGTDIGIVESTDNGATWHLLNSDFPSVSVYDMKLVEDEVVVGTHGRGIWTVKPGGMEVLPVADDFYYQGQGVAKFSFTLGAATTDLIIYVNDEKLADAAGYEAGTYTVDVNVPESGIYEAYVTAKHEGYNIPSNKVSFTVDLTDIQDKKISDMFTIYPNPSVGTVYLANKKDLRGDELVSVTNLRGSVVHKATVDQLASGLNLTTLTKGYYVIRIHTENGLISKPVLLY